MKFSEVTVEDVKQSIGYSADDQNDLFRVHLAAGRAFIRGYTNLPDHLLDEHEDIAVALLCVAGELFEQRTMTVESDRMNPAVKLILGLYADNHI